MPGGGGHHGNSARNRARQIAHFQQISAGAAFVLRADGADSVFGCPCFCSGSSLTCSFDHAFLPHELNGVMSLADYSVMVAEVSSCLSVSYVSAPVTISATLSQLDQALKSTHLPMFPLIFAHFLIPFSPICAMMHYQSKRTQKIQAILHKYNNQLAATGYFWYVQGYSNCYTYHCNMCQLAFNYHSHLQGAGCRTQRSQGRRSFEI